MHAIHLFGSSGRSVLGAGLMVLGGGCFSRQELPVRSPPPREVPAIAIEPAPQAPAFGRIVLDSTDGHATVEEVVEEARGQVYGGRGVAFASTTSTKPVCTTPCVADLPHGNHQLVFRTAGDEDPYVTTVLAGAKPSILRVAPTRTTGPTALPLALTVDILAMTALILGPAMIVAASGHSAQQSGHADDYRSTGTTITLAGGIALGIGVAIDFAGRGTIQPGSATQWEPSDGTLYRKVE